MGCEYLSRQAGYAGRKSPAASGRPEGLKDSMLVGEARMGLVYIPGPLIYLPEDRTNSSGLSWAKAQQRTGTPEMLFRRK